MLAVVLHHIAADGESVAPLLRMWWLRMRRGRQVGCRCSRRCGMQFADFALWQHRVLGAPDDPASIVARQAGLLADAVERPADVVELPADRVRPVVASGRGANVSAHVPADLVEAGRGVGSCARLV